MGIGAHASHFARQDAQRHGAKTPLRKVLGGAQGRSRETTGSSVWELRGGSSVILAESALPCCLTAAQLRSQQLLRHGYWTKDEQEVGLHGSKMTCCHSVIFCKEQWNTGVVAKEEKWGWQIRDYSERQSCKYRNYEDGCMVLHIIWLRTEWCRCALTITEFELDSSSVFLCIYDRDAMFSCSHGNHKMSICVAAVCSQISCTLILFTTSKIFVLYFHHAVIIR